MVKGPKHAGIMTCSTFESVATGFLVGILALEFGCKRNDPIETRVLSEATGDAADFEELDLLIMWGLQTSGGGASTTFAITDPNGAQYLAAPANVSFLEKSGSISDPPSVGEYLPLGLSETKVYPSLDLDLTFASVPEQRFQWCHTPQAIPFGSKGKVRCYKRDSKRGQFVTGCLASKSTLSVGRDLLACVSNGVGGTGDYSFNFGDVKDPGITIEGLPMFRDLQAYCASNPTFPNITVARDPANPRLCSCTSTVTNAAKSYDLWKVAAAFLSSKPQAPRDAFADSCSKQKDIAAQGESTTVDPKRKEDLGKENLAICTRLEQLHFANLIVPQLGPPQCVCKQSKGTVEIPAPSTVSIDMSSVSSEQLIDQCFGLAPLSNPDVCSKLEMNFVAPPDPAAPNIAKCVKSVATSSAPAECQFLVDKPKVEFVKSCLQLGTPTQSPPGAISPPVKQ